LKPLAALEKQHAYATTTEKQQAAIEKLLTTIEKQQATIEKQATIIKKQLTIIEKQQATITDYENENKICSDSMGSSCNASRVPEKYIVNGQNVMTMSTRDGYSFGLQLLNMFFTPEEMNGSLVYQSKRSGKPALNREKVSCL